MIDESQENEDGVDLAVFQEERVSVRDAGAGSERFALLYQIGKRVLSPSSADDLNQLALSLVFDFVNAERGALLLRDPETGDLVPRVLRHRKRGSLEEGELRVPTSILHEVVSGQIGILTSDAFQDPRFKERSSIRLSNIRSALCAPLWDGEEVLGVVYLDSRVRSYAFTREDLMLLNAIANLIAIRLKQEALYDQLTRERIVRSNLERYHSKEVVEAILARAKDPGRPDLGLEEREATILFGDLKGFTHFAEGLRPSVVAESLSNYYDVATRIVFEHGGTVLEFAGDSVMAIFGAPIEHRDHASRSVCAGLALLRAHSGVRPEVRVAVNSGRVVVGNVGSPERLKYAVVGDAVNVAARLEGMGDTNALTLGEDTYRLLEGEFPCEDLGPQKLRGREVPVRVYRIRA